MWRDYAKKHMETYDLQGGRVDSKAWILEDPLTPERQDPAKPIKDGEEMLWHTVRFGANVDHTGLESTDSRLPSYWGTNKLGR